MKILSLDQATSLTAWAYFEDGKLLAYDLIAVPHSTDTTGRVSNMVQQIAKKLDIFQPDLVVFEDVNLQTNVKTLVELARLQGRIMQLCDIRGLTFSLYKPAVWRKEVGIKAGRGVKRAELKKMAMALVKELYQIDVSNDVAEAICIGLCAEYKEQPEKKEQKENEG